MTNASSLLTTKERSQLEALLHQNMDIFAQTQLDMLGINLSMATHKLNILLNMCPMRQKVRNFRLDPQKVIQAEINKLLAVGFIREVTYLDWLANIMVVPMKEGTWRMCADYTNLNDACPNDRFSLPRIDQIFYSTFGNGMFSFLDNFFEYHQIFMFHFDKEKTVFSTLHRLYCYNVMSFRLKNVGVTYQRLMKKNLQTIDRTDNGDVH